MSRHLVDRERFLVSLLPLVSLMTFQLIVMKERKNIPLKMNTQKEENGERFRIFTQYFLTSLAALSAIPRALSSSSSLIRNLLRESNFPFETELSRGNAPVLAASV